MEPGLYIFRKVAVGRHLNRSISQGVAPPFLWNTYSATATVIAVFYSSVSIFKLDSGIHAYPPLGQRQFLALLYHCCCNTVLYLLSLLQLEISWKLTFNAQFQHRDLSPSTQQIPQCFSPNMVVFSLPVFRILIPAGYFNTSWSYGDWLYGDDTSSSHDQPTREMVCHSVRFSPKTQSPSAWLHRR